MAPTLGDNEAAFAGLGNIEDFHKWLYYWAGCVMRQS
jgi:hypothetical protein